MNAFISRSGKQELCKWVKWNCPIDNWFSLNTNGVAIDNLGLVGYGGLIRDSIGSWIASFCRELGKCHNVMAKLWRLLEGLKLVVSLNIDKLIIQVNASVVVDLIVKNTSNNILLKPLLFECRILLDKIPHNAVIHTIKEANHCANLLVKR